MANMDPIEWISMKREPDVIEKYKTAHEEIFDNTIKAKRDGIRNLHHGCHPFPPHLVMELTPLEEEGIIISKGKLSGQIRKQIE